MATDRYQLRRRLGRGGMAEVFEAVALGERGFSRRVAVKRMLPEFGRVHDNMFLDEARIASHLHHANIVAILDYGLANELPFHVLEFVEGLDLRTIIQVHKKILPVELALYVCKEVAHALAHAHGARGPDGALLGIVHRDVKPANILVSFDGDVKLTDFGIALAKDRLERTEVGMAKGTRAYMSPEQLIGGEVDGRSDVFALGCVLNSLLTGRSPADGPALQELLEGNELTLDRSLPEDVAAMISLATRRQKKDRYQSANEMAEAIGAALVRRVEQDAKILMTKWMAALRIDSPTPPPPLNEEIALSATVNQVRRFAAHSQTPARRLLVPAIAAAAGIGLAVLVGLAIRRAPAVTPTVATTRMAPATPAVTVTPTVTATPTVATTAIASRDHAPAHTHAATPLTRPNHAVSGHVLIGGEGALKAEISVDGETMGFAPKLIELRGGRHKIDLQLPNGKRLSKRVQVSERHTPSSPERWLVP